MNKTLANCIETLMEREGLKPTELALKLGIPKATMHKIITGKSERPRSKTLTALSEYFNIPIAQLLKGNIDEFIKKDKIRSIPIIEWDNICRWLDGSLKKETCLQTTPINLDVSEKSFALVFNDISSTIFKPNSVLLFDPSLEVKDGTYALVKLSEYPDILLRQIVCDASNAKYLKSLNQEFSTSIKKLESTDKIVAVLIIVKTLYYHK